MRTKPATQDARALAWSALLQVFEPLTDFVIDTGLSTSDLNVISRHAAVKRIASRQLRDSGRVNISGIAAITGIPRSEISRILKSGKINSRFADSRQQSTNRILAAWSEEPKFTTPNGEPADLKIYGRGSTFDALVKRHGCGIPTRAILDELVRTHAVELLSSQKVRAKMRLVILTGITPQMIRAFGDRAAELIDTLVSNMRHPDSARFVASISGSASPPASLPLFRREMADRGAAFLADIKEGLVRPGSSRGAPKKISVTIFYHEADTTKTSSVPSASRRRNLRRQP